MTEYFEEKTKKDHERSTNVVYKDFARYLIRFHMVNVHWKIRKEGIHKILFNWIENWLHGRKILMV